MRPPPTDYFRRQKVQYLRCGKLPYYREHNEQSRNPAKWNHARQLTLFFFLRLPDPVIPKFEMTLGAPVRAPVVQTTTLGAKHGIGVLRIHRTACVDREVTGYLFVVIPMGVLLWSVLLAGTALRSPAFILFCLDLRFQTR